MEQYRCPSHRDTVLLAPEMTYFNQQRHDEVGTQAIIPYKPDYGGGIFSGSAIWLLVWRWLVSVGLF